MSVSWVVAGAAALAGGLAVAWRKRRVRRPARRPLRRPKRLDLADLKAMGQKRLEAMADCRITLLEHSQQGDWWRLVVRVEPPTPEARWWPWGVSVECPQRLALRDAAREGPALQGALARRVEGHALDAWLCGTHSLVVWVQPQESTQLEVGYYGRPVMTCFLSAAVLE